MNLVFILQFDYFYLLYFLIFENLILSQMIVRHIAFNEHYVKQVNIHVR